MGYQHNVVISPLFLEKKKKKLVQNLLFKKEKRKRTLIVNFDIWVFYGTFNYFLIINSYDFKRNFYT